jgi:RNA polymerase sigma factor (sigma-70 family)
MVGVDDLEEVERKELDRGLLMEGRETPEAALIAKADANRLEVAIAQLPVPFREALVLRDVQGLEYREIAEVIKAPIGTVMSRLARARNRLIAGIAAQEGVGKT